MYLSTQFIHYFRVSNTNPESSPINPDSILFQEQFLSSSLRSSTGSPEPLLELSLVRGRAYAGRMPAPFLSIVRRMPGVQTKEFRTVFQQERENLAPRLLMTPIADL